MAKAVWKDVVLAESDDTIVIEGNHYFPPDSVQWDRLAESDSRSRCFWKGRASYYHVDVNGDRNRDAAWTYPEPSEAAAQIKGYLAFWRGVKVSE